MKLSTFLTDMVTTGTIRIEASQLRDYAQQWQGWERAANRVNDANDKLRTKIGRLEAKLALKELEEATYIDLFA